MKKIRIRTTRGRSVKYLKAHDSPGAMAWTPTESKALLFSDVDGALQFISENKKEETWFAEILTWDEHGMMDVSSAWAKRVVGLLKRGY